MGIFLGLLVSYLLGSFPTAYLMGRWRKGIDIRQEGSHNMGAMNTLYRVGVFEGIMVLLIDIAKGLGAVLFVQWLDQSLAIQMLAGATVILGHIYPVFLKFRGGKGGATCIGVLFALMPQGIPIYLALFALILIISRFITLAYSVSLWVFPVVAWLVYESSSMVTYSIGLLIVLGLRYVPRAMQIRSTAGGWNRALFRRNLKERF
ncbi:MAG: glycerol-3-phosphate acyltransferase [Dehalococcoidia bacterium]|nr:glycerol-3-phosphate acyltransferase [Dehalococcoidia bacterium]